MTKMNCLGEKSTVEKNKRGLENGHRLFAVFTTVQ